MSSNSPWTVKRASGNVSGWVEIFSAPNALHQHIQWSITQLLNVDITLQWSNQPLLPGSGQCRLRCSGAPGMAGRLAHALAGWHYLRFDISEEASTGCDGSRYLATPTLGLFHGTVGGNGDLYLSENRIRAVVDNALRNGRDVEAALEEALGKEWEDELAPFRIGQEGMRWLHATG
jgi:hypothetical protein